MKNLSFEFFPPKTAEGMKNLEQTAKMLATYAPDFFSVTYGAGGSTRQGTLDTAMMVKEKTGLAVAPHLACMGSTCAEILEVITKYQTVGFNHIVALRGDMPSGMGQPGEFKYAAELVQLIREQTGSHFHIEVAAYPECHPQAINAFNDVFYLKKKVEAGASSAITQYFFNPDAYFYFVDKCAKLGITIPIVPGIMPITQFEKLVRFSQMCGAEIPRWLYKRLEDYGDDASSIKAFGLDVVSDMCNRLIAGGAPGLHFYTLNQAEATVGLLSKLGIYQVNPTMI